MITPRILLFSVLLCLLEAPLLWALEGMDVSILAGPQYYDLETRGSDNSDAAVTNLMSKIEANLIFMEKFFLSASGAIPLARENETEQYSGQNRSPSFKLSDQNLEFSGGYQILDLLNPFVGLSLSRLSLERKGLNSENESYSDQTYKNRDLMLGLKGAFDFNDYSSMGYTLTYFAAPFTEADFKGITFDDINASKLTTSLFFKYWLPNELFEMGLHLYGGRYLYDRESSANELLPETDVKFIGAFLSLKVNM